MTALCVRALDGRVLLELDDHGKVVTVEEPIASYSNLVPQRIAAAAAGGLNVKHFPPELEVVYADDVEVTGYGESVDTRGPWVTLRLLADDALKNVRGRHCPEYQSALEDDGSTLRCVIFKADQVHYEEEPESRPLYTEEAAVLFASDFLDHPDVQKHLPMTLEDALTIPTGNIRGIRAEREHRLARLFGEDELCFVSPAEIYLWAVDHGVADHLPECYRNAMHHEEIDG